MQRRPYTAGISGDSVPEFDVIIPPPEDIDLTFIENYTKNVLIYSRIENDNLDPDFYYWNKVARVGLVKNPFHLDPLI